MEKSGHQLNAHTCNNESYFMNCEQKIEELFIPEIKTGFDCPITKSDFTSYLDTCDSNFQSLMKYVETGPCRKVKCIQSHKKNILSLAIILFGEHVVTNKWTTSTTSQISELILNKFLNIYSFSNVTNGLVHDNCSIFKTVLNRMRPRLLKKTWKNYPASMMCYKWVLLHIKVGQ